MVNNIIRLGGKKKKKKTFKAKLTGVLTKTATIEAGVLGTLLGGPILGLKAAGFTGLTLGALQVSPRVREFVVQKVIDPTGGGRFIGEQIEKFGTSPLPTEKGLLEKIKEGAKKAGILGAVVAGGVGAGALIKAGVERVKKAKSPAIPKTLTIPAVLMPSKPLPPAREPFGAAQRPPKEEKPFPVTQTMPNIINKIRVAPEINISFRQSRKFINQQILIRK